MIRFRLSASRLLGKDDDEVIPDCPVKARQAQLYGVEGW